MENRITSVIFGSTAFGEKHFSFINDCLKVLDDFPEIQVVALCLKPNQETPDRSKYKTEKKILFYSEAEILNLYQRIATNSEAKVLLKIHQPRNIVDGYFLEKYLENMPSCGEWTYTLNPKEEGFLGFSISSIPVSLTSRLQCHDYRQPFICDEKEVDRVIFDIPGEYTKTKRLEALLKYDLPDMINLELTMRCNLRCKKCDLWKKAYSPETDMKPEVWKRLIEELAAYKEHTFHLDLTGRGETLLHHDFCDILYKIKEAGNITSSLNSNGHLLNGRIMRAIVESNTSIQISVDSLEEKEYKRLQPGGGSLKELQSKLRRLIQMRNESDSGSCISVSVVCSAKSKDSIPEYIEHWRRETDLIKFQALVKGGKPTFTFIPQNNLPPFCKFAHNGMILRANGDALFCFNMGEKHYGNLYEAKSLQHLWISEGRRRFLSHYIDWLEGEPSICRDCSSKNCYGTVTTSSQNGFRCEMNATNKTYYFRTPAEPHFGMNGQSIVERLSRTDLNLDIVDEIKPISARNVIKTILNYGHCQGELTPNAGGQIPREAGNFIYNTIKVINPRATLEIGFGKGLSSLFILAALDKSTAFPHVVIDPFQVTAYKGNGLKNVAYAGFSENIEFIEAMSHIALHDLLVNKKRTFDFVFIDSCHKFDTTLVEWFYVDKMLEKEGVIAFDDCIGPVASVLNYIEKNNNYRILRFSERIWLAIKGNPEKIYEKWYEFQVFKAVPIENKILESLRNEETGGSV
jgi:MoaA/NifB/PqqE/SkfB family radical SAM enzyme/predicted O-methyltransferase YrrM